MGRDVRRRRSSSGVRLSTGLPSGMRTGRTWLIGAGAIAAVVALGRRLGRGMRWYQMVYRTIYRVGVIFWQRESPATDQL